MKQYLQLALLVFATVIGSLVPRLDPLWTAEAHAAEKMWRMGFLSVTPRDSFHDSFFRGLREFGYDEGENLTVEWRLAAANEKRLAEAAALLAKRRVNVIVARGTQATLAAKNAATTIPIVMTGSSDPVGTGLVANLARPGANVTGMSILAPDLAQKRLELLRRTLPVSRIGVLGNPWNTGNVNEWKLTRAAATELKLTLIPREGGAPVERYLPRIQITDAAEDRCRGHSHRRHLKQRANGNRAASDK